MIECTSNVIADLVMLRDAASRRAEVSRTEAQRLDRDAIVAGREVAILDGAIAQLRRSDSGPPPGKPQ